MSTFLIDTESRVRQLLALLEQGLTYAQILEREHIPLTRSQLKWRMDLWKRKLGLLTPTVQHQHFPRLLPPQDPGEATTAYHQRVMALGLGICHWCHHQTAPGRLFCELRYGHQTCETMVRRIVRAGDLDGGLCGCDAVAMQLGVRPAPARSPDCDAEFSPGDMSGIRLFIVAMLDTAWNDAQGLSVKASAQDIRHAKLWLRSPDCLGMVEVLGISEDVFLERVREVA